MKGFRSHPSSFPRAYPDASWAHGRRDFFNLAKLAKAPIAIEIVRRIDELFAIERAINGVAPEVRRAVRRERSKPLVAALEGYMREQYERLSPKNDVAKAIRYMLTRWPSFTRFLDHGKICLSNNAAERALRCVAVGRRNWTFAGSDEGGHRAAAVYSLITTCKLNDVDPRAWLADVLTRLPDHPAQRIDEICPGPGKLRKRHAPRHDRRRRVTSFSTVVALLPPANAGRILGGVQ